MGLADKLWDRVNDCDGDSDGVRELRVNRGDLESDKRDRDLADGWEVWDDLSWRVDEREVRGVRFGDERDDEMSVKSMVDD